MAKKLNEEEDGRKGFPPMGRTPREDSAAVMKFYRLARSFPTAALAEAEALRAPGKRDLAGRLDLRGQFVFTCDPVTARDYDDALSLSRDARGRRVLGVHIADVSHYVQPGTALDKEAFRRSTSVYLADRVVPMLPERLSNGVCSLAPGEDRLAFSVFMTFDESGAMVARSFAKSVIRSRMRFTYEQVMAVIAGGSRALGGLKVVREVSDLAQQLRRRRFAAGALDLEVPEVEVLLDTEGELTGLVARPYDASHQMVEECMVAANEAVARELWANGVKVLARLHEPPDEEKLDALRSELRGLGIRVGNLAEPAARTSFLSSIKAHPLYPTLATMVLRSMKRAVYDAKAMGHFGLAKEYYAHFTSPIRRYPDLTLHRQLADWLDKRSAKRPASTLARWARHASEREELATEAERALVDIKRYRYLSAQLSGGEAMVYEGVIERCLSFGCFVSVPEIGVSGLVHVSNLARRFVRFDARDCTLSVPGGATWRAGDRLRVRVAGVDFEQRRIDFVPAEGEVRRPPRGSDRDPGRRGRKGKGRRR